MSAENINTDKNEQIFTDDMKDYLLLKITVPDLEVFKKEIESEILMRQCTEKRYNKYHNEIESLKRKYMEQKKQEIDKFTLELEKNKTQIKRKFIKEEEEEEEENFFEEDDDEKPKSKLRRGKGRPKKNIM